VEIAMSVFDDTQIEQFKDQGFVIGRDIIPRGLALDIRDRVLETVADNLGEAGWKESMRLLHDCLGTDDWSRVQTNRLKGALDQLLSSARWQLAHGFGSWPVLFPGFSKPPWQAVDMTWHVEGRTYEHWLDSPEIGITMILLFSDIAAGDGGTAIAVGSHRVVARILSRSQRGFTQMALTGAYLRECPDFPVVETHGRAGDILFLHPFTVHATSLNIGNSVRVACNCRATLHERLRTTEAPGITLSPVEQAIANSISAAREDATGIAAVDEWEADRRCAVKA
jgi:ectoine hydroxylase-related dioxygenase (phytanoyl-CoA dioxygenase family)